MKLFECGNCSQLLFFENTCCGRCGHALGFISDETRLATLVQTNGQNWAVLGEQGYDRRYCANYSHIGCNWLVAGQANDAFCLACSLNQTIPNLDNEDNLHRWRELEQAKRRLLYSLLRLGLPLVSKQQDPRRGLAFDFLEDAPPGIDGNKVFTGHDNGLITLNIIEADDVERESRRKNLDEAYRTLLGHFRHEVGHYYWDILIGGGAWLEPFRGLFGDERIDYAGALEQHYAAGKSVNWQDHYVSSYAASHPWEDWAETWAHYLHMIDTLETAYSFGLRVQPRAGSNKQPATDVNVDPCRIAAFDELVERWFPLTVAINSLNRSMGHKDFYPFVLPPPTLEKLAFVHQVVSQAANAGGASQVYWNPQPETGGYNHE